MPPPSGSQPSSMLQGLQGVLGELGALMAAPDADPQFLMRLQMVITGKIKQGTQQAIQGQQQPGGAGGPGMGPQRIGPGGGAGMSGFGGAAPAMAGGGPPGMGPGMPPGGGPPGAGAGAPMGAPNADELRRVMGATGQTQ